MLASMRMLLKSAWLAAWNGDLPRVCAAAAAAASPVTFRPLTPHYLNARVPVLSAVPLILFNTITIAYLLVFG